MKTSSVNFILFLLILLQIFFNFLLANLSELIHISLSNSIILSISFLLFLISIFGGRNLYFSNLNFNLTKNEKKENAVNYDWSFFYLYFYGLVLGMALLFFFTGIGATGRLNLILTYYQYQYEVYALIILFIITIFLSRVKLFKSFSKILSFSLGYSGGCIFSILLLQPFNSITHTFLGWGICTMVITFFVKLKIFQMVIDYTVNSITSSPPEISHNPKNSI